MSTIIERPCYVIKLKSVALLLVSKCHMRVTGQLEWVRIHSTHVKSKVRIWAYISGYYSSKQKKVYVIGNKPKQKPDCF
jgi:hypothetical protein